jgi:hypothetical protein
MVSGKAKRKTCKHCGGDMGLDEFVEIRILDHIPTKVQMQGGSAYTSWHTKTLMTEYICPMCAIGAVDRIKENRK